MIEYFIVLQQIEDALRAVITYYHDHLGVSWGFAIVMLTVTVRLAILPLTIKQFRSMAAMQRIQPKVKAVQNKYKGKTDRESKAAQQKEMMELYKEHNVNPFASCLPLVFQMPVFIGLYQVLRSFHPTSDTAFLGIDDIFEILGKIGGTTELVMVVLYAASMLGSMLLFSFVQDRQQKFLFARHVDDLHHVHHPGAGRRRDLLDHHEHLDDLSERPGQAYDGTPLPGGREAGEVEDGQAAVGPHAILPRMPAAGRPAAPDRRSAGDRVRTSRGGDLRRNRRRGAWAALHELERRFPSLQRDAVQFVILSEGERGLLGVGYQPARVLASVEVDPDAAEPAVVRRPAPVDESPAAARVRDLLTHVLEALAIDGDLDIDERDGVVTGTVTGSDLGLLIGKHGQTIDAIQYLANAIMHRREEEPAEVVVDAEGYRKRRERTLHEVAVKATAEAASTGRDVALEPMTSVERKIVHTKVQSMAGFATASEGAEPNRFVVVRLDHGD